MAIGNQNCRKEEGKKTGHVLKKGKQAMAMAVLFLFLTNVSVGLRRLLSVKEMEFLEKDINEAIPEEQDSRRSRRSLSPSTDVGDQELRQLIKLQPRNISTRIAFASMSEKLEEWAINETTRNSQGEKHVDKDMKLALAANSLGRLQDTRVIENVSPDKRKRDRTRKRMKSKGKKKNLLANIEDKKHLEALARLKVATPIFVASLPKSATVPTWEYFRCGGLWGAHRVGKLSLPGSKPFPIGKCMMENIHTNRPMYAGCGTYDLFADAAFHGRDGSCFYPALDGLKAIYQHYPNSTILLMTKNATSWYYRFKRGNLRVKLQNCNITTSSGYFPSRAANDQEWLDFYEWHKEHVRSFARDHPSLTYLEYNVEDPNVAANLQDDTGVRASCWKIYDDVNAKLSEIPIMNKGSSKDVVSSSQDVTTIQINGSLPPLETSHLLHLPATSLDLTKPVKVFILMGQSNMLGFGAVRGRDRKGTLEYAVYAKKRFPYLVDKTGRWKTHPTVRNVGIMGEDGEVFKNEWLTVGPKKDKYIGPEVAMGWTLGHVLSGQPVLLLKSCIGNRALGWDLLPPGSKEYEYKGWVYPGYKGSPENWRVGDNSTSATPTDWYAGKQYDIDAANAKEVLSDIGTFYPGAKQGNYEIAGLPVGKAIKTLLQMPMPSNIKTIWSGSSVVYEKIFKRRMPSLSLLRSVSKVWI